MPQRMAQRADTAANWTSNNPTLAVGEIGIETNTKKVKVGDGTTEWNSLVYFPDYKVDANNAITGATKCKITYDVKGLVTAGEDLAAADVLGVYATLNAQTGTTYEIAAGDNAKLVTCSNANPITVTLPNNLTSGFQCALTQLGAGQVTFSAASGATLRNRQAHTKTGGQYGTVSLFVISNSGGSAAEWLLVGDTAI